MNEAMTPESSFLKRNEEDSISPSGQVSGSLGDIDFGNIGVSGLSAGLGYGASRLADGLPGVGGMVSALSREAISGSNQYGPAAAKSAITSLAGFLGNLAVPGLGILTGGLASYATKMSLADGWMGDAFDVRSDERKRDTIENYGYTRSQTEDMARQSDFEDTFGAIDSSSGYSLSPTLDDADTLGRLADKALGDYSKSFGFDFGDDNDSDDSSENDGSGGQTGGDKDGGRY